MTSNPTPSTPLDLFTPKPPPQMAPPTSKKQPPDPESTGTKSHRSNPTTGRQKSEILINVYDLLPPGTLSNALWFLGSSLLHTGVVIPALEREYAFGGHSQPDLSGVYWTKPRMLPPGGTWRCELLQGFTFCSAAEIEGIVQEVSGKFLGTSYNLLSHNCNHFTSFLCEKLVGKTAPAWLNRAASIGIALPCVVPREWVAPPDAETMDGELVDDDDDGEDERTSMLRKDYQRARNSFHGSNVGSEVEGDDEWDNERVAGRGKGKSVLRDTAGRVMPVAERAPDLGVALTEQEN